MNYPVELVLGITPSVTQNPSSNRYAKPNHPGNVEKFGMESSEHILITETGWMKEEIKK